MTFVSVMADERQQDSPVVISQMETQYKHKLGYAIDGTYMTLYLRTKDSYLMPLGLTVFYKGSYANFNTLGDPVDEEPEGIVYV